MSVAAHRSMSLAEFLSWEERQPLPYEFDGFRAIGMNGGTGGHSGILRNLAISIGGRLRGQPCQFHGSGLKIAVAGRIRYPDGFVACTPVGVRSTVVRDPVVIFEVLSESTATTDYGAKNEEYAATPSVRRYVILSQNKVSGTMFERLEGDWIGRLLSADSVLHMPEIGIELPLAELYIDVAMISDDAAADEP